MDKVEEINSLKPDIVQDEAGAHYEGLMAATPWHPSGGAMCPRASLLDLPHVLPALGQRSSAIPPFHSYTRWMRHNHPKRRQHTVAEVYLKGFADERGRVEVAYRHGKHAPSSIRNASVQNFFYTFDDRGKPNAEIEDWMGEKVETAATGPLERLRAGLQPQAENIAALAPFVAVSLM